MTLRTDSYIEIVYICLMFRPLQFLLCICLISSFSLSAQWKKIYTGISNDLFDVHQAPGMVYAAGQGSTVLKSADSGKSWKKLNLTIPSNLRTVYFFDSLTGMVSGENARIQKTYNGGKTWTQKYVRTAAYTYDMTFNGSNGIAVGKDLLAISSNDAGETWTVDTTPLVRKQLNSVAISPSGHCWTVGDSGFIFKKHLSDKKWTQVNSGSMINLTSVSCIGDSIIIITGGMPDTALVGKHYNILLYSSDAGQSWFRTTLPELKTIYSSWFQDSDTGFICGTNGIISKSYQIFNFRSQQLTGTASALNKIDFQNNNGLVVGDGGTILRTTNRGGRGLSTPDLAIPSIKLYPNPSSSTFTVSAKDHQIISLTAQNINGQSIDILQNGNTYSCDYKGILILRIQLDNQQIWNGTIALH